MLILMAYFRFRYGPTNSGTTLGVVRLGGHREYGETGWECASREAYEEATLRLTPLKPPAIYWYEASEDPELIIGQCQERDVEPILVGKRSGINNQITPIYFAKSADAPKPAAETKGILLLNRADILKIVTSGTTLGQYLECGGKAVFNEKLQLNFILEPFPHLRLLETLLRKHPELECLNPYLFNYRGTLVQKSIPKS